MKTLKNPSQYVKAIVGFIAPGVLVIGTALVASGHVTSTEWGAALVAMFGTGAGVYSVTNAEDPSKPAVHPMALDAPGAHDA